MNKYTMKSYNCGTTKAKGEQRTWQIFWDSDDQYQLQKEKTPFSMVDLNI